MQPAHEPAIISTEHHVSKLIKAIGDICTTFAITELEMQADLPSVLLDIKLAEAFIDPKPQVTAIVIVLRNSHPLHAFRDAQQAINFCMRTTTTANTMNRQHYKVALPADCDMLVAEYHQGSWYFEPHDDERNYPHPLLIVPIQ